MKILSLLTLASHILLFSSAVAKADAEFPFSYLAPGSVGLCPGVAPNVLSVGTVGATRSGGSNGTEEIWTQGQTLNDVFIRYTVDARAAIEGGIRGFNYKSLNLDQSFARAMDPSVALMEKLGIRGAKISVCMSRFNLASVNQNHSIGTVIDFDLGFRVSVGYDSPNGRQALFVQELGGSTLAASAFYDLYYDFSARPLGFITNSWPVIQNTFDRFLRPVSNPDADRNLRALKAELGDIFN